MAEEPTILCFETGNELGGWGGKASPPPVAWTRAVAAHLKQLAPQTLVMSGSYGVRTEEFEVDDIDIVSDHFYPTYSYNLKRSANRAHGGSKVFINGEFDWTDRYRHPLIYLAILIPAVFAASVFLMPARWWPWRVSLGCCCRRRRKRKQYEVVVEPEGEGDHIGDHLGDSAAGQAKHPHDSTASLTTPLPTTSLTSYPPSTPSPTRKALLDRSFPIRRWQFALFLLVLCAPLGAVIHAFMPDPLHSFLSSMESLSAESKLAGSFYWSLFGREASCCNYVQHNDGYTLHYPSDPSAKGSTGSGERVAELTRHAWKLRGVDPPYLTGGLDALGMGGLPSVQCPQLALAVPANASRTGGTGGRS